jgi:hypothetical protein
MKYHLLNVSQEKLLVEKEGNFGWVDYYCEASVFDSKKQASQIMLDYRYGPYPDIQMNDEEIRIIKSKI